MASELKTVLITGASRGVGLHLTQRFLAAGDWRVLATCRQPDSASELQRLAAEPDGRTELYRLDVANGESVANLKGRLGGRPVDVLINNAGIIGGRQASAFDMDYDLWMDCFMVNTMGPLRVTAALMDNLRRSAQPKIITISSQMGSFQRPGPGSCDYRSTKAAVNKVMQGLAAELAAEKIIVTVYHPGWVQTDMGGAAADITPEMSADGLYRSITSLDLGQSGQFYNWNGTPHPW